jgi:pyruvate dehydrogenase E2 component (dihydrolipoamide acetyltransferase)
MAEKILMTALSPTMDEGTIMSWQKKEGDTVTSGDVLCEVETDKASMDYESTQEGVLLKILVDVGGSAQVGNTIAIIGAKGDDITALLAESKTEAASAAKKVDEEKAGAAPEKVQSAPADDSPASPASPAHPQEDIPPIPADGRIRVSPLAAKLAAMRNINLGVVKGTGPGGRIIERDIRSFSGSKVAGVSVPSKAAKGDTELPVSGKRTVIAKRLSESKFSAPHYYLKVSVDMGMVLSARSTLNKTLPKKVSLNAFFIKFAAEALKRHPHINASWQGDKILQYGSIDIGLAVDLGTGLITPVVRDCGNRGVVDIDTELSALIEKTREGRLKPEEYTGATFTISNLGSFGIEEFTAIINPPGSAILALGMTRKVPVVSTDGSIIGANIMKMSLSCDHRVIDGAAGGRFLYELQQLMEQPARLIL